ncbi:MAG: IS4 family transposase, partial [Betaproteobacteria bacterium]
ILLNLLEVNMFDKTPIDQMVTNALLSFDDLPVSNQLNLFDY